MPTGLDVAEFLGRGDDGEFVALADQHVDLVTAFVRAYTRDRGFTADEPSPELASVIVTATARLVVNPAQLDHESADGYIAIGSFAGWTLPELAVLHRYRKRAT